MSTVRETKPREVFCTTCGAFQGAHCLTTGGYRTGFHQSRRDWAAQHVTEVVNGAKLVRRVSQPIGARE